MTGRIVALRVTHERASVDEIEAAQSTDQQEAVEWLLAHDTVSEVFVLYTCNRAEAYVVSDDTTSGRRVLSRLMSDVPEDVTTRMDHTESLRHLLRVATGLDSMLLGEDQILGQVRDAYVEARQAEGIGPVLEEAVTKAIHVGKRARSETVINEGVRSLGSAAASVIATENKLCGATALVVGTGEVGHRVARTLVMKDVGTLILANRSPERAKAVATDLPSTAVETIDLDRLATALERSDVVISATASQQPVITVDLLPRTDRLVILDLAQPRDVASDIRKCEQVVVRDLDDLQSRLDETRDRRQDAVQEVRAIIDQEFEQLLEQYRQKRVEEVIGAICRGAETIKRSELATAVAQLDEHGELSEDDYEIVESLADALVSQLMAAPIENLRESAVEDDWETIRAAIDVFDPVFEGSRSPSSATPSPVNIDRDRSPECPKGTPHVTE